jgi:hypothetical protein
MSSSSLGEDRDQTYPLHLGRPFVDVLAAIREGGSALHLLASSLNILVRFDLCIASKSH